MDWLFGLSVALVIIAAAMTPLFKIIAPDGWPRRVRVPVKAISEVGQ